MKSAAFLALVLLAAAPAWALEKGGMPDLAQIDNTCLPTSTANLLLWFGKHGYPKLILSGESFDDRADHTVHVIMADTAARYDLGTEMDSVTSGIRAYISRAGYPCEVEYRGLDGKGAPFTQNWLQDNDDPNKGFILLLTYCRYDRGSNSFSDAWNAGHAVTLVNAEPDMLLIHDPAHDEGDTGRKIVTPFALKDGTFLDDGKPLSVAGLLMLSGSLLGSPPESEVMLTGAVCVTMHPLGEVTSAAGSGPHSRVAGNSPGSAVAARTTAATSLPAARTWWGWFLSLILGK